MPRSLRPNNDDSNEPLLIRQTLLQPSRSTSLASIGMNESGAASDINHYLSSVACSINGGDDDGGAAVRSSSTLQTIFNTGNVIMGVSLLSLPYAFKMSGWAIGIALLLLFALVGSSSAKILAGCQEFYFKITGIPLLTYGDIGEAAFGPRGRWFIQFIFSCELFAACVALFILVTESLFNILPTDSLTKTELTLIIWSLLTVSTWPKSLTILSYGSMVGILCLLNLVFVIYFDGFYKQHAPGSLWEPAETFILPQSWIRVPISFGIFMAGFEGHACFPGFYSSMQKPHRFGFSVNTAFTVGLIVYLGVASAGYLMFGEGASSMITDNLKYGYPQSLYFMTMILMIINPATKYALVLYPIVTDLEKLLFGYTNVRKLSRAAGVITTTSSPSIPIRDEEEGGNNNTNTATEADIQIESETHPLLNESSAREQFVSPLSMIYQSSLLKRAAFRTVISFLVLVMAILVPEFEKVIGLLGSLFGITSSILFPCMCYLAFFKSRPPQCVELPVDIRRSSCKWHEPGWLVESNLTDWEFVPQWKRGLAMFTMVFFFIVGVMGTVWTVLPESVVPRK